MEKSFKSGEVIFNEGDVGRSFYDIKEGLIGIYADYGKPTSNKLEEIGTGHILGEMAILDDMPRSATAVSLSDVLVNEVNRGEMDSFFKAEPDRVSYIAGELCERLSRLTDDYLDACTTLNDIMDDEDMTAGSLAEKIKRFAGIYNMGRKYNQKSYESTLDRVPEKLKKIFAQKSQVFKKDTVIFKEGEEAGGMYDIISGEVDIYTGYGTPEEKKLTTLSAGMFFGEIGMLSDKMRTATAVTSDYDTELLNITLSDFKSLLSEDPERVKSILRHLSFRIRTLTNDYMEVCGLISQVSEALDIGQLDDELMSKVKKYRSLAFLV